jgi:Uma2 family endonuclease
MTLTVAMNEGTVEIPFRIQNDLNAFREWAGNNDLPEKAKVFFHRGEVWVYMGKEQLFTHVLLKTEITSVLYQMVKARKAGHVFSDGVLLTNKPADLSGNPDAVYVSNEAIKTGRMTLVRGKEGGFVELLGTPDMVLEVVSDSSEKKDNQTLFEAYFEAGIPEYWLVDARGAEVEFTIYKHAGKKYAATRAQAGGWQKSAVFGKSFRITRATDASGNPEFTLRVR